MITQILPDTLLRSLPFSGTLKIYSYAQYVKHSIHFRGNILSTMYAPYKWHGLYIELYYMYLKTRTSFRSVQRLTVSKYIYRHDIPVIHVSHPTNRMNTNILCSYYCVISFIDHGTCISWYKPSTLCSKQPIDSECTWSFKAQFYKFVDSPLVSS